MILEKIWKAYYNDFCIGFLLPEESIKAMARVRPKFKNHLMILSVYAKKNDFANFIKTINITVNLLKKNGDIKLAKIFDLKKFLFYFFMKKKSKEI